MIVIFGFCLIICLNIRDVINISILLSKSVLSWMLKFVCGNVVVIGIVGVGLGNMLLVWVCCWFMIGSVVNEVGVVIGFCLFDVGGGGIF